MNLDDTTLLTALYEDVDDVYSSQTNAYQFGVNVTADGRCHSSNYLFSVVVVVVIVIVIVVVVVCRDEIIARNTSSTAANCRVTTVNVHFEKYNYDL